MYERIYAMVRLIPSGRVATYGQIAAIVGICTPRQVGYAMAALPFDSDVPWQRVINRLGKISMRSDGRESITQRQLLEAEGIHFGSDDQVDLSCFGWHGPDNARPKTHRLLSNTRLEDTPDN